jgi:hypothetical protein
LIDVFDKFLLINKFEPFDHFLDSWQLGGIFFSSSL